MLCVLKGENSHTHTAKFFSCLPSTAEVVFNVVKDDVFWYPYLYTAVEEINYFKHIPMKQYVCRYQGKCDKIS